MEAIVLSMTAHERIIRVLKTAPAPRGGGQRTPWPTSQAAQGIRADAVGDEVGGRQGSKGCAGAPACCASFRHDPRSSACPDHERINNAFDVRPYRAQHHGKGEVLVKIRLKRWHHEAALLPAGVADSRSPRDGRFIEASVTTIRCPSPLDQDRRRSGPGVAAQGRTAERQRPRSAGRPGILPGNPRRERVRWTRARWHSRRRRRGQAGSGCREEQGGGGRAEPVAVAQDSESVVAESEPVADAADVRRIRHRDE